MTLTLAEGVGPDDQVLVIDGAERGVTPLGGQRFRLEFEVIRFRSEWPWPRFETHPEGRQRWRVQRGLFSTPMYLGDAARGRGILQHGFWRSTGPGRPTQDPNGPEGPVSKAVAHDAGAELAPAPRRL